MKWIAVGVGALVLGALLGTALPVTAQSAPEIPLVIEKNRFQPDVIKVKAGQSFVLVITNKNPKAAEFESKDLRVEKVVPAGKTVNVRIRALKPGSYAFFDDFNKAATGRIVAE